MFEDIISGVLSNLVWIIALGVIVAIGGVVRWKLPVFSRSILVRCIASISIIALVAASCLVFGATPAVTAGILFVIATALLVHFSLLLHRLGFVFFAEQTSKAIDAGASLRLARERFDFLGIGAHKLTQSDEFEDALVRCASGNVKARFLVSPEKNSRLEKAAQRNGYVADRYTSRVRDSVQDIIRVAESKKLNIEIREYNEIAGDAQQFRLVFLNDDLCLMSWTVWDKSEGKANPQIALSKGGRQRPERTMYRALKDYFEDRWDAAGSNVIYPTKVDEPKVERQ